MCNEGFEKESKIKKHIEKYHHRVLLQIMKEMYENKEYRPNDIIKDNEKYKHVDSLDTVSEDEETDGEDDDAFLAKFDEDGQLIDWRSAWSQGTVLLLPCIKLRRAQTVYCGV